jgi:hypothetical protein
MAMRRIVLTVETDRVVLRGTKPQTSWCYRCSAPSVKVSIEQATIITGISESSIFALIETSRLHLSKMADGQVRVCMRSLSNAC